ncbi:hypothetical protein BDV98DRAFT_578154, partial [Pterulicium gracile]
ILLIGSLLRSSLPSSFANPSSTFLVPHHQIVGITTPVETTLLVERNRQVDQLHVLITD